MERALILTAVRTPIGRFLGALSDVDAPTLAAHVIEEAVSRSGVPPTELDEVLVGNAISAGTGQNVARQAALDAGVPREVPATTVSMMGGSSLRALVIAQRMIEAGAAHCVVVAGVESASRAPHLLSGFRKGQRVGNATLVDSLVRDALWDPRCECLSSEIAENVAREFNISRQEQDEYALLSHQRCTEAWAKRRFLTEIVPVFLQPDDGEPQELDVDQRLEEPVTAEMLAQMRPAVGPKGTVTPGNYAELGDGAASVVVASESFVKAHGLEARYAILGSAVVGVDPLFMPLGAAEAAKAVLDRVQMTVADIDLAEIHENYAVVVLAAERELKVPREKVNVLGGAISLGHPVGAEALRMLTTLFHEIPRRGAQVGLVSAAVAGGQGVAVVFQRI